jgi:hypothetical protein
LYLPFLIAFLISALLDFGMGHDHKSMALLMTVTNDDMIVMSSDDTWGGRYDDWMGGWSTTRRAAFAVHILMQIQLDI